MTKRKIRYEGNQKQFNKLTKELDRYIDKIVRSVQDAGPGQAAVSRAIDQYNEALPPKPKDMADEPLGLALLTEDTANTMLQGLSAWILFSAVSSMQANMGQSNYVAANLQLD